MDASPRVGDGLIRLDADGVVQYASPNAPLRLPPPRPRRRPGRPAPRPDHRRTRPRPRPGGRGAGQTGQRLRAPRVRGRGQRRRHPAAGHPAQAQGHPHRLARTAARRHRTAPPRARVDHQGRHHPGDPPPGEEQPPDGRRAVAAAGPPDGLRRRAARRSTRRCGGSVRSPSCTRRSPRTWTSGSSSTRSPTGCIAMVAEISPARSPAAARAASASSTPRWPPRWRWCSPRCCRTRWSTPSAAGERGTVEVSAVRGGQRDRGEPAADHRPGRRLRAARGLRPAAGRQPGAADRPHPGGGRTGRHLRHGARRRSAARGSCSTSRSGPTK